jgi:hypothetical protein
MTNATKRALVAATVTAATLGLAGSASAATATFADRVGDMKHGADIASVKVVNEKNVRVVIQHADLVRSYKSGASGTVWLDTDPAKAGPEFAFVGGFFEGTDYALVRTDGWRLRHRAVPLQASYEMKLDYVNDVTRIRISRAALDRPGKVRVAVKVGGEQRDGDIVHDWLGERRALSSWVQRG